jgi:LysM repeat protein
MPTSQQDFSSEQPPSSHRQTDTGKAATEPLIGKNAMTGGHRRSCPTCHAPVQVGQPVCSSCGTHLQKRADVIRCRYCKQRASSQLVICPGCGRELQPAGSMLLSVGLPGLLVALLAFTLVGRFGLNPFNWAEAQMHGGLQVIENIAITPVVMEDVTSDDQQDTPRLIALRPLAPATEQNRAADADSSTDALADDQAADIADETTGENVVAQNGADENSDTEVSVTQSETASSESSPSSDGGEATLEAGTGSAAGEPEVVILETPAEDPPVPAATDTPAPTATDVPAPTATDTPMPTATERPLPTSTSVPTTVVVELPTATPTQVSRVTSLDLGIGRITESQPTATTTSAGAADSAGGSASTSTIVPLPSVVPAATPAPMARYTVKSGDTFVDIATRYGIPTDELMIANGLTATSAANLPIGRVLVLPGVVDADDERGQTYVVQPGETFVGIALRFNVATEALLRANGLTAEDARTLQVGQVITIPSSSSINNALPVQIESTARPAATPTPEPIQYIIRAGDTVVSVARRYGTTSQALLSYNGLTEARARTLKPGDVLLIPR